MFKKELAELIKIPEIEELIPRGYHQIGDIVVLNLSKIPEKYHKKIAEKTLEIINARIIISSGKISGELRIPKRKILAVKKGALKSTETIHKESNCIFKLDVAKIMYSKGNIKERNRVAKQIKKTEIIVDMFAGIGYFTIPFAKNSPAKKIYAIELNPKSFKYLKENIKLNKVEEKVVPIKGDCRVESQKIGKIADRISMGYLPSAEPYLDAAIKIAKKNAIIHYHIVLQEKDVANHIKKITKKTKLKLLKIVKVKDYAPKTNHYVLEFKVL